ncbi:MAG TPA: hypothetical protein VFI12_10265 [Thermomicrobiales bacterium]|nr:hypothetical protein [Thermomicrobiales bacterium]
MPLPQPEPEPEPKKDKKKRKSKEPAPVGTVPAAPPDSYSYSYGSPPSTAATSMAVVDAPDGSGKNKSGGRLRLLLVLLLLLAGGVSGMMYWNEHPSSASGRVNWDALTEFDFANVWNPTDDATEAGTDSDLMAQIPEGAVQARAISVAEDGLITIRYKGKNTDVRLAGVPADFADQCLGAKGVARLDRILPKGAVIYVLLDGEERLGATEADGPHPQFVYLWRVDADANKVRYANQELVVSGEAELAPVTRFDHPAAQQLEQASMRATEKQKGRFGSGACP